MQALPECRHVWTVTIFEDDDMQEENKTSFMPPYGALPSRRQIEWYQREKMAFFHFGMNTFTSDEWGEGKADPKNFCPEKVDCRQWIRSVKAAGFRAAILTAKHHDGFCLWPSRYTEYSIKNSPYKNGQGDIVREFTDACREYGIKAGLYLSPWDRHEKTFGTAAYDDYYAGQLTELMSGYGKIYECWWDGAQSEKIHYDWGRYAYIIRNLQPECVIFGSLGATEYAESRWVGNESGYAGTPCWSTISPEYLRNEVPRVLNTGNPGASRFIPAEADTSIRPGWFYHKEQDDLIKSSSALFQYWFTSVGSNAVMLLNIPPAPNGLLKERDVRNLLEAYRFERQTFAFNLAAGSEVSESSREEGHGGDQVLTEDDGFYRAKEGDASPVLTISFPTERCFDCFCIGEAIEYGQRVRHFKVEAFVQNEWKEILRAEGIGYKRAFRLEALNTEQVRITIEDSMDEPVIRHIGVYKLPEECFPEEKRMKNASDLANGPSTRVHVQEKEIEVEFGGIFPFNTIRFNGEGVWEYEIQAFNGVRYETIYKNSCPNRDQTVSLPETQAYKMRMIAKGGMFRSPQIAVYDL